MRQNSINQGEIGVIPVYETLGEPVPGSYNRVGLPDFVSEYVKERSDTEREYAISATKEPEVEK